MLARLLAGLLDIVLVCSLEGLPECLNACMVASLLAACAISGVPACVQPRPAAGFGFGSPRAACFRAMAMARLCCSCLQPAGSSSLVELAKAALPVLSSLASLDVKAGQPLALDSDVRDRYRLQDDRWMS